MGWRTHVGMVVVWWLVLLLGAGRVGAITFDDPVNFGVKNTWTGAALGLPNNLGGLIFSADGDTLYVVGAAAVTSALYAVPVTRDAVTHEVTALGPSAVQLFSGDQNTAGLDAGWEVGPSGTLFYVYWSANKLGERPAGFGTGAETLYAMATSGVPTSMAGLTFSPHRLDAGTGFGKLQISVYNGPQLYEVPLAPAGTVFTHQGRRFSSPRCRRAAREICSTFRRDRSRAISCT